MSERKRPGRPRPTFAAVDPGPRETSAEDLCSKGVLQVKRAAKFAGISLSAMKELIRTGEIVSFLHMGRRVVPRVALVLHLAKALREQSKCT